MQSRKKKTMKTNKQNKSGAQEQIRNTEQNNTAAQTAAKPQAAEGRSGSDRKDNRDGRSNLLPIDLKLRQTNRMLPTEKVIELLRAQAPEFFRAAEVIGKWVWIQFTDKQPREITAQLAQFGFHWNNKRQAWQHPCGVFRKAPSTQDPRERYGSSFPADAKAA